MERVAGSERAASLRLIKGMARRDNAVFARGALRKIHPCRTPKRGRRDRSMDGRGAGAYISPALPAGWQSGYAEDCKSSYSGSIPLPASNAAIGDGGIARPALL